MSRTLTLQRLEDDGVQTTGVISLDGLPVCFTIELAWKDNRHDISCIPPGLYPFAVRNDSSRFSLCIALSDVPDRLAIEMHNGGSVHDTRGCIIPTINMYGPSPCDTPSHFALAKIINLLKPAVSGIIDIRGIPNERQHP